MPEIVGIDRELCIIVVDSSQQVEADDLRRSLESVLQIAHHHGLNKILVDATDLASLPSISDLFGFASELSSRARNLKHAIVVAEQSPKNLRFIETTAYNRGAIIQIFSSRDNALAWLNQ